MSDRSHSPLAGAGFRYSRTALLVGLLLAGLLLAALPAAADFADDYRDGLDALEAGNHAAAERYFRQAIAERPESERRIFFRLGNRPYVPHYQLGVALFELGDCEGALEAWGEAQRQAVIDELEEEKAELARRAEICRQRRAELEALRGQATAGLERADQLNRQITGLASDPQLAPVWSRGQGGGPSFSRRQLQAAGLLESARQQLAAAGDDRDTLQAVQRSVANGVNQLESLLADAQAAKGRIAAQRQDARGTLAGTVEAARRELAGSDRLAPFPPGVAARRQELAALLAAADSVDGSVSAQRVAELTERLQTATRNLQLAAAPPPAELLKAGRLFLAGEYQATIDRLAATALSGRGMAQVHLLRAAAHYALFIASGQNDEAALAAARGEAVASRKTDGAIQLNARIFSPRFIRFFEEAQQEAQQETRRETEAGDADAPSQDR